MPNSPRPVVGLDIGGANTKAAVVDSGEQVRIVSEPFEVWREPEAMSGVIAEVVGRLGRDPVPVALTTTAELVDVFADKREGVLGVLEAAGNALPGRRVRVMTNAGELVSLEQARAAPLRCAAAVMHNPSRHCDPGARDGSCSQEMHRSSHHRRRSPRAAPDAWCREWGRCPSLWAETAPDA